MRTAAGLVVLRRRGGGPGPTPRPPSARSAPPSFGPPPPPAPARVFLGGGAGPGAGWPERQRRATELRPRLAACSGASCSRQARSARAGVLREPRGRRSGATWPRIPLLSRDTAPADAPPPRLGRVSPHT